VCVQQQRTPFFDEIRVGDPRPARRQR